MIELSVILPMFRAKYIGWLPFEGLIRQKGITFEWELIIAEEQKGTEVFGVKQIEAYRKRLEAVGCKRIEYIPLKKWIPLGTKLARMVQQASEASKIYVGHSADYYSAPTRLASHYKILVSHETDHHLPVRAIHYSIAERRAILQDTRKDKRKDHVIGRATRMALMRNLPLKGPRKGCDSWMFKHIRRECKKIEGRKIKIKFDHSDMWKYGLSTFGFNNISSTSLRRPGSHPKRYTVRDYPVSYIKRCIPAEIMKRLDALRPQLINHRHLGKGGRKRRRS